MSNQVMTSDLENKCRGWIDRNIPRHTQHEYCDLLARNDKLVQELCLLGLRHEELMRTHSEVVKELYDKTPVPNFRPEYYAERDMMRMEEVHTITWRCEPFRQRLRTADDLMAFSRRYDVASPVGSEMREHFLANVAPALWEVAASQIDKLRADQYHNIPRAA